MSTNSHSKGLSKDAVEKSRAARSKYREKQKSEAIQKTKRATDAAAKEVSNLNSLQENVKELQKKYDDGKHPEFLDEYQKASKDLTTSSAKVNELQIVLKKAQRDSNTEMGDADAEEEVQKSLFVEDQSSGTGEKVLESVEEHTPLLGPPNVTSQNGNKRSGTPGPDRGTDFGRWTPAEEDEYNIEHNGFTPVQARESAGLEQGGEIVAWAEQNNSKPVIVGYGPRNSRKYRRSTAAREAAFLDESKTPKFGPRNRKGDEKPDGQLIRKPHEFKAILGVAFNCPIEELAPKAPKEKSDKKKGDEKRTPRVDIWVKWEINGEVHCTWEVRSSIKYLFRSFCDLYIYEAAVHFEAQHDAYIAGKRTAEDRSPTPLPRTPAVAMQIKDENQAVDLSGPEIQITNEQGAVKKVSSTTLSPIKQYREEWCDLQDIGDPKNMTISDGVNFKLAWDMFQLKLKA
ncbi:hypothetical protein VE00_07884 [Pseudogymnoascus sp. WSF 3629]|nr:hypothetical protein VE00_07884 [Pseudogymnoascus sp. WSF 3629]